MEKILVIDDEKDNLTILDFYLKQKGYDTILTISGKDAISIAKNEDVDLIILDIMMPEMDGFEVCKELKANPVTSDIPVIFLTARYLDKKDLIYGLSLGAIDYITKPFDEGELFARINVALKIRKIEKTLKFQRDYLNTIINSMGNDILIINPDLSIDMANLSFLKRRNINDIQDILNKPCHEVSFNIKNKCFNSNRLCPTQVALEGTPYKEIFEFIDESSRKTRYINISAFPIFDEKKNVTKIVEIQEDVTEMISREKEIAEVNQLLENILQNMADGVIFLDYKGNIIRQNNNALEILKRAGKFENNLLIEIGNISFNELFKIAESKNIESKIIQIEDKYYKLNPQKIEIANTHGLILTISDITQELKTQEELLQSAKLVSIGELAASIAHEVNSPVTGIIGYSELLSLHKSILPQKVNDIIDKILKESYRVKNIIENLLKFSRRQQITDMSYVDLGLSLKEIVPLMEASFQENDINFIYDIPDDLPLIFCNSGLIQQAVLNLLQNAFDAITTSNKGNLVELKVYIDNNHLNIIVSDNGPGIPPEITDKIFEPFFTTKGKGKGTGLGLSLIHRIVQIHNGEIKLETSKEGTKFKISLPISEPKVIMPDKNETIRLDSIQNRRAIIIDDDPTIVDYLSDILLTFKFAVDEVRDKKESLQLLKSYNYDIIIIDIKLPDGDGFDIYNYLLENHPDKTDKVVFITGDVSLDMREKLKKTGKPFLIKPFSFNELINTLRLS